MHFTLEEIKPLLKKLKGVEIEENNDSDSITFHKKGITYLITPQKYTDIIEDTMPSDFTMTAVFRPSANNIKSYKYIDKLETVNNVNFHLKGNAKVSYRKETDSFIFSANHAPYTYDSSSFLEYISENRNHYLVMTLLGMIISLLDAITELQEYQDDFLDGLINEMKLGIESDEEK